MSKNVTIAPAEVRKAYNKAKAQEVKAYGAFVAFVSETAKEHFKEPIAVATFAAFVGDDLSVGKEVSEADKAERNRIRARIRYGLEQAGLLLEKKRKPAASGSKAKAKPKGEAAAAAVENAADIATTNPKDRFSAVVAILDAMTRDELTRVANAVAQRLAAAAAESPKAPKAPRKRAVKKAA